MRTRQGWAYQQLADALGYAAPSYVYEIEAGKKTPTVAFAIKVARLFGVSTDALILDERDMHTTTEMESLASESDRWRQTADQLMERSGLLPFLEQRGEVYFTGSYRYGLMISADIDLYLIHPQAGEQQALNLLHALIDQRFWNVYLYGDWVRFRSPEMPVGYYVGLKRDFAGARWKIDIWNAPEIPPESRRYNEWLIRLLTPEARQLILAIKKANIQQKWEISSVTIYDAVLTGQAKDVDGFRRQFVERS